MQNAEWRMRANIECGIRNREGISRKGRQGAKDGAEIRKQKSKIENSDTSSAPSVANGQSPVVNAAPAEEIKNQKSKIENSFEKGT